MIVHLYEEFGPECLSHLNGMFAFAIWDPAARSLLLARDRMGQKPLYYAETVGGLVFASEPKALFRHPAVSPTIDPAAIGLYLAFEYVPAPASAFGTVRKLPAGHRLVFAGGRATVAPWWQLDVSGAPDGAGMPEAEAVERLRGLLTDATRRRLLESDVPVGLFLSGGIDSSLIAALARADRQQVHTFSIGFDDPAYDESPYARQVAEHLGTEHHHRTFTAAEVLDQVPRIADLVDEPFADASIFPTCLLSQFARERVTVCLGGDGGDELCAGYQTFQADRAAELYRRLPHMVHGLVESGSRLLPARHGYFSFDFKLRQFLRGAALPPPQRFQAWIGSFLPDELAALAGPALRDVDSRAAPALLDAYDAAHAGSRIEARMLQLYGWFYLQNDILHKADQASMAHSLELRAPFLDVRVVEFLSSLPADLKIRGRTTKCLLKRLAGDYLPTAIVHRRKQGFGLPLSRWLQGDLKPLLLDMLSPDRLRRQGWLDAGMVTRLVDEHVRGRVNHRKLLWTLLMLQIWLDRWTGG